MSENVNNASGIFLVGVMTGVVFSYAGTIGFIAGACAGMFVKQQNPVWVMAICEALVSKVDAFVTQFIKKA